MAALRPVVLVFQEFAEVSVAAAQPDLDTLIAGPAYHIQDFPEDQTDIGVGDYASDTAACDTDGDPLGLPVTGVDAIVVADPPNNVVGAILDSSTVEVWADEVLVQVDKGIDGVISTTTPDENLFTSAGADFTSATGSGVAIGDRVVFTTAEGTTYARIVQEVVSGTQLRFTQNWLGTASPTRSTDINGAAVGADQTETGLLFRVERELSSAVQLDSSFYTISGNEITIEGGITTLVDINGDGSDQVAQVNFAEIYIGYLSLRQDLAAVDEIETSSAIESTVGRVDERNPLAVGLFVAFQNTTTPLKYFGVTTDDLAGYQAMLDLVEPRNDIYAIVPMTDDLAVILAVETHVDALAAPEIGKFRIGIGSSEGLPAAKTIGQASITGTAEQITGDDIDVFALDAATFQTDGLAAGDTLAVVETTGTVTLAEYTVDTIFDEERFQITGPFGAIVADEVDQASHFYAYRGTGQTERSIAATGGVSVTGADTIDVGAGNGDNNDVGKVIRLTGSATNLTNSPLGNNDYLITGVATDVYTVVGPSLAAEVGPFAAEIITTTTASTSPGDGATKAVTFRQPYRRLLDINATFSSDGVVATDFVEIPTPAVSAGTTFTAVEQYTVNAVDSENRLTFVDGTDLLTTDIDTGQADIGYRVRRDLSKAGQVEELVAVVESVNNKRIVMVWPDEVLVSGVTNELTAVQNRSPGYYLAAVVGGLSAGLPAHQGFTNIGVAGIDQIFNSTRYFSRDQITELSNSGWFVFEQETTESAPYVVHQLTTDVSTTENGELSIVRDFDFISYYYKAVLEPFIGRYNINAQTLDLIRTALSNATLQLRSQTLPRIGAPIIDADIVSVEVFDGASDRVEIFMDVQLPFPLNRIGLHLVA